VAHRGGGGSKTPTTPKIPKALQNGAKLNPIVKRSLKLLNLGRQHPKMLGKKGSTILKLPSVRNCFTLAMTNKLVVIINSLKVPKIKKNFTIQNEISCTKLQLPPEPLTRGLPPPDPLSVCPLSSTEFVETPRTPLLLSTVKLKAFHTPVQELQSYNHVMLLNRFRGTTSVQLCCLHLLLNSQLCTHIQYSHTTLFGTQDPLQFGTLQ